MQKVYITETCLSCGIEFGITKERQEQLRKNHKKYYCPNGHNQWYTGEHEAEKLSRQLEAERAQSARLSRMADYQRKQAESYKGHLTRLKNKMERQEND